MLLIIRGLAQAGPAYEKERSREDMDQLPAGTSSAALLSRAHNGSTLKFRFPFLEGAFP